MQRIPIIQALPGMKLALDVRRSDSADGPPICGRGVELNQSLIDRLRRMGIQTITVMGNALRVEEEKTPQQLLDDLDRRFRKVAGDPLTGKLKNIYREYLTRSSGE
jgi:hypothetical protein